MSDEYKEMLEKFEQICQNAKKELCAKEEKEKEKRFLEKIDKELTITEYDEIKYWLTNVEILDNTDYILHNRKAKILVRYIKEKDKEIERLNNIIDELEKSINEYDVFKEFSFPLMKRDEEQQVKSSIDYEWRKFIKEPFLNKLKELKEGKLDER